MHQHTHASTSIALFIEKHDFGHNAAHDGTCSNFALSNLRLLVKRYVVLTFSDEDEGHSPVGEGKTDGTTVSSVSGSKSSEGLL